MLPIHKAVSKDTLRPAMQYIQVINGFCYATDAHKLVKIPVSAIFDDLIADDEELYFNGAEFGRMKFDKATTVARFDNQFMAFNKKGERIGIIEALSEAQFFDKVGRFPNCEQVIPDLSSDGGMITNEIAFNAHLMSEIQTIFGEFYLTATFYGASRAMVLRPHSEDKAKFLAILMPCHIDHKNETYQKIKNAYR